MAFKRAGVIRNDELRRMWLRQHPWCMVCGVPAHRADWPGLQVHHLIPAAGRSDELCNFLSICQTCHNVIHGAKIKTASGSYLPALPLGVQLTIKATRDPVSWDPDRLAALAHWQLPSLMEIPSRYAVSYRVWRPRG